MTQTTIVAEPGQPTIEITRRFTATPDLLFRAWTDPDLVPRWLGPREQRMEIDLWELRDGGRWRYVSRGGDGVPHAFHGVFHGTPSVANLVQTFEYEGAPGHVSLDSLTFQPDGDGTVARSRSVFQSVAARDAMISAGMEGGVLEAYERLDELIAADALDQ